MFRKIILLILCFVLLLPVVHSTRTATTTVIPSITAQSAGVILQCSPFIASPGSVTIGGTGFVRINCPRGGAVVLDGSLTPSFVLGIGYDNAVIMLGTASCSLTFDTLTVGTTLVPTGSYMNRTITFSSSPIPGQMLTGSYDYCLHYTNAPSTGLAGFNIVWT